jgi:hypothetical protein
MTGLVRQAWKSSFSCEPAHQLAPAGHLQNQVPPMNSTVCGISAAVH